MDLLKSFPIILSLFVLSWVHVSRAHVAQPNQMVRLQPQLLSAQRPWTAQGTGQFYLNESNIHSLSYTLEWSGPGHYQVIVNNIPERAYRSGLSSGPSNASQRWVLQRQGSACRLIMGTQVLSCAEPGAWAVSELSGQPERVAEILSQAQIIRPDQVAFQETNLNQKTPSGLELGASLILTRIQNKAMALAELKQRFQNSASGQPYPSLRFEQTHFSLMQAHLPSVIGVLDIEAHREWPARREGRFVYMLSEKLHVRKQDKNLLILDRKRTPNAQVQKFELAKPSASFEQIQGQLTEQGWTLLQAIVHTH